MASFCAAATKDFELSCSRRFSAIRARSESSTLTIRVRSEQLVQDVGHAIRRLRQSRGFFLVAVLLIAIGIGANTVIFTAVDAVLLRPLPVDDPQNLVQAFEIYPNIRPQTMLPYGLYQQIAAQSSTLFDVIGQFEIAAPFELAANPERVYVQAVTENFFSALGVPATIGRVLESGDDHVAVLSFSGWVRHFGGDPGAIGRTVRLGGHPFQIIGVTPEGFNGTSVDTSPDFRIPYGNLSDVFGGPTAENRSNVEIIARTRPGISLEQAQEETAAIWRRFHEDLNARASGQEDIRRRSLDNLRFELRFIEYGVSSFREQFRTALLLLVVGTGLLLLMVSSNVGGLLLARAAVHERETAVRLALGASRTRIVFQWLMDSVIVTVVGGVAGLGFTYAAIRWVPAMPGFGQSPGELRALSIPFNPNVRVFGFFMIVLGVMAVLSALAPAWRSLRGDLYVALKGAANDRRHRRLQFTLSVVQIAFCTLLLVSASQMVRTLSTLRTLDTGFDREHVATFSIDLSMRHYDSQRAWSFQQRLLEEARAMPGVEAVGIAFSPLMRGIGLVTSVAVPGQPVERNTFNTSTNFVTPGYFDAMGIRLLAGRTFQQGDGPDRKPAPRIVNETFVRRFFGGEDPIGRRFGTSPDGTPAYEIVGVVSDSIYRSLREVPPPIFYTPLLNPDTPPTGFVLHVRTRGAPEMVIQPVRALLASLDPALPVQQATTLSAEVERSLWRERVIAVLATSFGLFATVLSAMGLYGTLAYFVIQRRREIGLRIALGAVATHVVWAVSKRVLPTLTVGLLAGLALYSMTEMYVRSLLYGVAAFDPASIIAATLLLLLVGTAAAAIPAFQAIRVDPASTLRQD